VRLGAPEDFAGASLAQALARFAKAHPRVLVELHCETTPRLLDSLAAGRLDLTLATGTDGAAYAASGGKTIHRAPLAWAVGRGFDTHLTRPLPLAVFHQGCPYRRAAESALDAAGIPWRAAFSSSSLSGALAAVRAGLGVAPVPRSLVAPDCRILSGEEELPPLVEVEVTLHRSRAGACGPAAALLADLLAEAFADLG
jgi:DNA-binding transcriptional LysR family regulator